MGIGAGLYMYVVVVQKFTFAISSPDEFLLLNGLLLLLAVWRDCCCMTLTRFKPINSPQSTYTVASCFVNVGRCSGHMKDENQLLRQKLRATLRQKEPTVSMSELVDAERKAADDRDDVFVEQLDADAQLQPDQTPESVVNKLLAVFFISPV